MRDVTIDTPRACAIIITAAGLVYQVGNVENFIFNKSDNGDAGDFSLTMPLGLNKDFANQIAPMDLVAVFASRSVTWQGGRKPVGTTEAFHPITFSTSALTSLSYGSSSATMTDMFAAMPSCVFIGMVDTTEESQIYEGSPKASLDITGRDLTKVFLDNDTFVSYALPGSDPSKDALGNLENIVISNNSSGTALLLQALNVFCKKDPTSVGNAIGAAQATDQVAENALLAKIAAYGYPWDKFISTKLLSESFQNLSKAALPIFQVKSGSVWANLLELRNYPVARLYVNEMGQLIFDDTLAAWTTNPVQGTIYPSDIRTCKFRQSDENVITAMSILPAIQTLNNAQLTALGQVAQAHTPASLTTIQRFGFRYWPFTSLYDAVSDLDPSNPNNVIQRRFAVLWLMKNNLWTCQITLKGTTAYRVGTRVNLATGGASSSTQMRNWYISEIGQSFSYGDDWTTTLSLTYPDRQT